jgi:glycosyltransferase involved in cell wall biosynthesis
VKQKRLIVVGPLPPPYHGVTVSTSLVLANALLHRRFDVAHVDTSDHRSGRTIARWDLTNVVLALRAVSRLVRMLRGSTGVVYLPLSQSTPGFLRDSLLVRIASLGRWKIAGHLRGGEFHSYYQRSSPMVRRLIRGTLGRIDSIAVMGERLRGEFDGLVPDDRIAVVPNGTPEFEARERVVRDPGRVLFLSNLRRRKGVMEAVDAAVLVAAARPSVRFTFAGDWESPELEVTLRRRAEATNGNIEFIGPVEGAAKDELLASASVLLFPPVEPEGHPRVVLEAMAAGLPVVTTDRGAIRESVIDGVSGYVLAEPAPDRLAACLLQLLEDESLRERQSREARQHYLSNFTQDIADRSLCEWLDSVAAK